MKNFKNTLFVVTAALVAGLLAVMLSGCDGSGAADEISGDAGREDVLIVSNVDVRKSDTRVTSCQVPIPKYTLNGIVTTTPKQGYWIVEVESVPCLTTIAGVSQPTSCADPVDGFASGLEQMWFRVAVQKVGNAYYLASGYLVPVATGRQIMEGVVTQVPLGNWALCSPSGKFLGWGG